MNSSDVIVIMGRGGQGRVVMDAAIAAGRHVVGVLDDSTVGEHNGILVLGTPSQWPRYKQTADFALALSSQSERVELGREILGARGRGATIVHPSATIAPTVSLGTGTTIMANVTINANASLGDFVIINANCSVDHDCVLETGVSLGPGVTFPGNVVCRECSFIGAGVVALPGKTIGARAVVGAGSVVTKDVAAGTTVAGNPARTLQ